MSDVFGLLKSYDMRCERMSRNLPLPTAAKELWRGLGFKVGDTEVVVDIDQVFEIIDYCETRKVPLTKSWFHGVANIRGTLAAITDFREMLFGEPCEPSASTRIILLQNAGVLVGLLVDEVTGIRNSQSGIQDEIVGVLKGELGQFVEGQVRSGNNFIPVISCERLIESELFLSVQKSIN